MSTLLEQLDVAEAGLVQAEQRLATARRYLGAPHGTFGVQQAEVRAAETDVVAAAARAQITAARCLATTEDISDAIGANTRLANSPAPRPRDDLPVADIPGQTTIDDFHQPDPDAWER